MFPLPTFTFSISEFNSSNASSTWPAALTFPTSPSGREFSIMDSLPKPSTLLVFSVDLFQVLNQTQKSRVVH